MSQLSSQISHSFMMAMYHFEIDELDVKEEIDVKEMSFLFEMNCDGFVMIMMDWVSTQ